MPEEAHLLRLPALRGNDPLGFLAAVGLIALAEQMPESLGPLRLGWEGSRTPVAVCESAAPTLEELGERLALAFGQLTREGRLVPGVDRDFPIRKVGAKGSDPMRMEFEGAQALRESALDRSLAGDPWFARWMSALVAPAALHQKGYVELTSFYAPAGQMTVRGIFEQAHEHLGSVKGPADALISWRRASGYQGANLDERAVRTAEFGTDGKTTAYGAPSPTLLGLMGLRMWPVVDNGRRARTTAWLSLRLYEGYTRRSLIWPIWRPRLDAPAVRTILALPVINEPATDRSDLERRLTAEDDALRGYGVQAVFGSSRRTADQGDGPLGPADLLWARD